jgi:mannose-6-phosphate isomerase
MPSLNSPLCFRPVYKDYLWGGRRIPELFHRAAPSGAVAESWELADREEGMSVVEGGPWAGKTLADLVAEEGAELIGMASPRGRFPLLIKLIDAAQRLSVQVHPHDDNAARTGGDPKTEMWIVLAAAPGAAIIAGLKPEVDEELFRCALSENRVQDLMNRIEVKAGDAAYVPGGRVHAICEGCLILEVQQNSNTTYRLYDWGRVDSDGRPRDLHIDRAMEVIHWDEGPAGLCRPEPLRGADGLRGALIQESPYFRVERWALERGAGLSCDGRTFAAVFSPQPLRASGGGEAIDAPGGRTVLFPAASESVRIEPAEDRAEVIVMTLPGPSVLSG